MIALANKPTTRLDFIKRAIAVQLDNAFLFDKNLGSFKLLAKDLDAVVNGIASAVTRINENSQILTRKQIIGSDLPQFNAPAPKAPRAKVKALYAFTFIGGGYNHVYAFKMSEAVFLARKEFQTRSALIDVRSFKRIVGTKAIQLYFRRHWTD